SFFITLTFVGSNVFSQYCVPTVTPSSSYGITGVSLNLISSSSSANEGYVDRTAIYDTLTQDSSYTLNISLTNPNARGTFFIDWNQDMVFDSSASSTEKYVKGFSMSTPHSISVPASNPLGDIRMRVMVKGPAGIDIETPCGSAATEVEDYTLHIVSSIITGVEKNIISKNVSIYPNPVKENTNISFYALSAGDMTTINIVNITGKTVNSLTVKSTSGINKVSLPCKELSNGVYFVNLTSDNLQITQKIIITH
ncbi:MAG: T9SS type A sorting domain-containing protein, partial [Vicingaceae bacterium]